MSEPVCDVVVLTRTPGLFARCLRRVPPTVHGIVIDNTGGSTTIEDLAGGHGWTYHNPGHNTSFSEGVNLGFTLGTAKRVLLLNDDAILGKGTIEKMAAHDEPIVGCLIIQSSGLVDHAGVALSGRYPVQVGWRTPTYHEWRDRPCGQAEAVTFAVAMLSRQVHEAVGGLCTDYWYGYEDVDFCARAAELGHRSYMCYEATAIHDGHGTRPAGQDADADGRWRFLDRWVLHTDRMLRALDNVGLKRKDDQP